jgi:hypothetical protein
MYYDEDALMEDLAKWQDEDKRNRFMNRMKHKLNAKENQRHHNR